MNTILLFSLLFTSTVYSQEEIVTEESSESVETVEENIETPPDTTRVNLGKTEFIIVGHDDDENEFESEFEEDNDEPKSESSNDGHWAGVELGFTSLMNSENGNNFTNYPYWDNDEAKSTTWNFNFFEHKFNFGSKGHLGVTTGAGLSWTSLAFKDNYILSSSPDTVFATIDTLNVYSKNKLKATYFTVPLLLEFNAKPNTFYFAAGVIGAVRIGSKTKRTGEIDGNEFKLKTKATYGLESFKLDGTVRMGYGDLGVFANYSLLPLFDTTKTSEVYPLTFGLSLNF